TLGPDGDPVDAFLLGGDGGIPGLVVRARPIGVLQVEQREGNRRFRNDRLLFLPWKPAEEMPFRDVRDFADRREAGSGTVLPELGGRHEEAPQVPRLARAQGGGRRDRARAEKVAGAIRLKGNARAEPSETKRPDARFRRVRPKRSGSC